MENEDEKQSQEETVTLSADEIVRRAEEIRKEKKKQKDELDKRLIKLLRDFEKNNNCMVCVPVTFEGAHHLIAKTHTEGVVKLYPSAWLK